MKNENKRGFTLAETLIALGVIGILAAITIPTLIHHNREKTIRSKFKKVYAVMSEALIMAIDEYGAIPDCYYYFPNNKFNYRKTSCKDFINNYFFKKIKYQKYCPNKGYENGCIPNYKAEDFTTNSGCTGFTANNIKNKSSAVILQDGSILFTYGNAGALIGVDINGFDGPNQGGIDVYALSFWHTGQIIELRGNPGSGANYLKNTGVLNCLVKSKNAVFTKLDEILKE